MNTLWHKGYTLNSIVERYTVGSDPVIDTLLIPSDCVGSMAHARVLAECGILSAPECSSIIGTLHKIIAQYHAGQFTLTPQDEDCHSAIEKYLVANIGSGGEKIHTGRSRNDQVFTALLLYGRMRLQRIEEQTFALIDTLLKVATSEEKQPMMGRTHLQPAMPSTVGLWLATFAEQLIDANANFELLYHTTNRCPLGAAAGYGVALPLNRKLAADLLGFQSPIHTVLNAIQQRGHWEGMFLDCLGHIMTILSRLADDLLLFTLPEFGYFQLPPELCTGSSIMPHKHNPDILELMRAKARVVLGHAYQAKQIMLSLPSGYNRDVQEIKPLLVQGLDTTWDSLQIMQLVIQNMQVNRNSLNTSLHPHILSVDRALALVAQGTPFRAAYRQIAAQSQAPTTHHTSGQLRKEVVAAIAARTSHGAPGNLQLEVLRGLLQTNITHSNARHTLWREAIGRLAGDVSL